MAGSWGWFALLAAMLVFNTVLGEELLFRGFLLPRMNGVFGRRDWLANGVLFAVYHLHEPWVIPAGLLDTFIIAYPSKRYRSALIGIAVHSAQSVFFPAGALPGAQRLATPGSRAQFCPQSWGPRFQRAAKICGPLPVITQLAYPRFAPGRQGSLHSARRECRQLILKPCTYATDLSGSRFSGIAAISTARLTWPLSTSSLPAQRILLAQGFAERSALGHGSVRGSVWA